MTTPIYFPFTHMTHSAARNLAVFFREIFYLDVTGSPAIQDPIKTLPLKLADQCVQNAQMAFVGYQEWVKIHKGNEQNLKLLLADNPYFKDDTQVTTIKSRLRGVGENKDDALSGKDLEKDLLFLMTAHHCDFQNESIDQELTGIDHAKQRLIEELRGEPVSEKKESLTNIDPMPDPGEMMPQKRIQAWENAIQASIDFKSNDPVWLVTTSEAVFEAVESNNLSCLNALDIDGIKVHDIGCEKNISWQQAFQKQLSRVAQGKNFQEDDLPKIDPGCALQGRVKVNIFSGNEINTGFNFSDNQVVVCLVKLK